MQETFKMPLYTTQVHIMLPLTGLCYWSVSRGERVTQFSVTFLTLLEDVSA